MQVRISAFLEGLTRQVVIFRGLYVFITLSVGFSCGLVNLVSGDRKQE